MSSAATARHGAAANAGACEPCPAPRHVGDRGLPHGRARRSCRALRGLRSYAHRLQFLPQPPLPQVPVVGRGGMAGGARGRAAAGPLFPRGVHAAGADRRHRLPEQGQGLRPSVQGRGRDADHHRGRSEASRRRDRLHRPCCIPGDRTSTIIRTSTASCRRRNLRRRQALDRMPAGLFLAGARAVAAVPAIVHGRSGERCMVRESCSSSAICAGLDDADAFSAYLAPLRKSEWVVYAKRPFAGPRQVLAYLARYTHRVAISNSRLSLSTTARSVFDGRIIGRTAKSQGDDAHRRRVHPPVPAARAAGRLPSHSPLRPVRQRPPCREDKALSAASRVPPSTMVRDDCDDGDHPTPGQDARLPMLRRPDEDHRDIRSGNSPLSPPHYTQPFDSS